mmetsp:Transcript_11734/g.28439  ORF Transcript_11734/g.28439 Transcript_11734/m.28439 type:complete len:315 (-) Transcript_11734:364-1308(-)
MHNQGSAVVRRQLLTHTLKLLHPLFSVCVRVCDRGLHQGHPAGNRLRHACPYHCVVRLPYHVVSSQRLEVLEASKSLLNRLLLCLFAVGVFATADLAHTPHSRRRWCSLHLLRRLEHKRLIHLELRVYLLGERHKALLVRLQELLRIVVWLDGGDRLWREPHLDHVRNLLPGRPTLQEVNNPYVVRYPPLAPLNDVGLPAHQPRRELWHDPVCLGLLGQGPYDQRVVAQAAGSEKLHVQLYSSHHLTPILMLQLELLCPCPCLSRLVSFPSERKDPDAVADRLRHQPVQHVPPLVNLRDAHPPLPHHLVVAAPL